MAFPPTYAQQPAKGTLIPPQDIRQHVQRAGRPVPQPRYDHASRWSQARQNANKFDHERGQVEAERTCYWIVPRSQKR